MTVGVDVVMICTMGLFWDTVAYCIRGPLGWSLGTRWSAIGQFVFPLLVTFPEVVAKVNSSQFHSRIF